MKQRRSILYLLQTDLQALTKELLHGLKAIHIVGFVHGDINPGNILVNMDKTGSASVALDGFGKCAEIEHLPKLDLANLDICGLLHQAPEVIESQGAVRSRASDIWSLGVVLYYFSCGRMPFACEQEISEKSLEFGFADR